MMESKVIEIDQRILNKAQELFLFFGIKSISMDDIAKHLGISKKTLYLHFTDKAELVTLIFSNIISSHEKEIIEAQLHASNAIEEIFLQIKALLNIFKEIKPNVYFEIEKYFPSAADQFSEHRHNCMRDGIRENLERGINENLFRKNLDLDIVADIRLNQLLTSFDEKVYPSQDFNIANTLNKLTDFYLHAICTPSGLKVYQSHITIK